MVQTPLIYPGGKSLLLPHIDPLVPQHSLCLDLFGGGGAFVLRYGSEIGVYNDLNQAAVTFFRVLRDSEKARQLTDLLRATPYSRSEYEFCDATWRGVTDDVERSRRWFVVINVGFTHSEESHSFRVATSSNIARAVRNHVDRLPLVTSALRNVVIECLDFRRALSIYAKYEDHLIFADPPYLTDNPDTLSYENVLTPADHYELLSLLSKSPCQVILCGYKSEMYYDMLRPPVWQLKEKVRMAHLGTEDTGSKDVRVEHIWTKMHEKVGLWK